MKNLKTKTIDMINKENLTAILDSTILGPLHNKKALTDLIDNELDKVFRTVERYRQDINCDIRNAPEDVPEINLIVGSTGTGKTAIVHAMIANPAFKNAQNFSTIECFDQVFTDSSTHNHKLKEAFIVESILCSQDQRNLLVKYRKSEAYIRMFFVSTDNPLTNIVRVTKQNILKKSKCDDIRKVWERYFKSLAGAIALAPCANEVFLLDNSVDMKPPRVLAQIVGCGEIIHYTDDIPKWAYLFLSQIEQNKANMKEEL